MVQYTFFHTSSCDIGYYCPGGTEQQIQCDNGYYQDTETQASCNLCDAGHFCDNTGGIWVLGVASTCPKGYYCPEGTSFGTEHPCPVGTFNNLEGKVHWDLYDLPVEGM